MNAADAFLDDARAKSLDTAQGTTPGNSVIKCKVVGTVFNAGVTEHDQASFFEYPLTFQALNGDATYDQATITVPSSPRYNDVRLAEWIALNPLPLRNVNITGANDADILSTMQILPQRVTPMGQAAFDTIDVASYQTAQDFQSTRVQVPMAIIVDGTTYLDFINDSKTVTAFSYTPSFLFGPRLDRRLDVPDAGAVQIRSPGR